PHRASSRSQRKLARNVGCTSRSCRSSSSGWWALGDSSSEGERGEGGKGGSEKGKKGGKGGRGANELRRCRSHDRDSGCRQGSPSRLLPPSPAFSRTRRFSAMPNIFPD